MRYNTTLALVTAALSLGMLPLSPAHAGKGPLTYLLLYPKPVPPPGPCIQCGRGTLNPGNIVINPQSLGSKVLPGRALEPTPRPW
jgi:hypothetical protein